MDKVISLMVNSGFSVVLGGLMGLVLTMFVGGHPARFLVELLMGGLLLVLTGLLLDLWTMIFRRP